jgi:anaerobic magnesium-protoporphyrin IX monomethyl ester cyclase
MLKPNKILLVHPLGYKMESAGQDVSRIANIMPPLGLASIAAYLKNENMHADIVDCYAKPFSDRFIREYLTKGMPSFIGHKDRFWRPPCVGTENKDSC